MQKEIVQDYIRMRNAGRFDLQIFWKMYLNEGGLIKNPQEFSKHFLNEIQSIGVGMEINTVRDRNEILLGIDKKLELTSLYNINGEFIKIVI